MNLVDTILLLCWLYFSCWSISTQVTGLNCSTLTCFQQLCHGCHCLYTLAFLHHLCIVQSFLQNCFWQAYEKDSILLLLLERLFHSSITVLSVTELNNIKVCLPSFSCQFIKHVILFLVCISCRKEAKSVHIVDIFSCCMQTYSIKLCRLSLLPMEAMTGKGRRGQKFSPGWGCAIRGDTVEHALKKNELELKTSLLATVVLLVISSGSVAQGKLLLCILCIIIIAIAARNIGTME